MKGKRIYYLGVMVIMILISIGTINIFSIQTIDEFIFGNASYNYTDSNNHSIMFTSKEGEEIIAKYDFSINNSNKLNQVVISSSKYSGTILVTYSNKIENSTIKLSNGREVRKIQYDLMKLSEVKEKSEEIYIALHIERFIKAYTKDTLIQTIIVAILSVALSFATIFPERTILKSEKRNRQFNLRFIQAVCLTTILANLLMHYLYIIN